MFVETIVRSHACLRMVDLKFDPTGGDIAVIPLNGESDFPEGASYYRIEHLGNPPNGTFPVNSQAQSAIATPVPNAVKISVGVFSESDQEVGRIDATFTQ